MRTLKLLKIVMFLILVLGLSYFSFFYETPGKETPPTPLILTSGVINQPLPKANLVTLSGQQLDDEILRHGKIVLAFMMPDCKACDQENGFLETIVDSRKDVRFLYVIPFGNKNSLLQSAKDKYFLEPVYDNGSNIAKTLEINQVPIKIFLEDGVIKRTWIDASLTAEKQTEFKNWLRDL
ncbi:MAG TPA: hypothetical protein VJT15_17135 [Pyrinomonadaceae bacterium]|nr:hypothetical protein [Pyrinomonadaceae bacterium]